MRAACAWRGVAWLGCALGLVACAGAPLPAPVLAFVDSAPKGSVPVVIFVDFECSYCKAAHARLQTASRSARATLTIQYVHVPLHSHEHATEAASAQICADAQGRGDDAANALLASGAEGHDLEHLLALARRLDLDEATFATCMTSDGTRGRLASDRHVFLDAQFDGVPVLYVGRQKLDGARSVREYAEAIETAQNR